MVNSPSNSQTDALPLTLAQRVQTLRERKNLTQLTLAQRANLPLSLIRDIEGGLELFLSSTHRLKLARVFNISPQVLRVVEKQPDIEADKESQWVSMLIEMKQNPKQVYQCPKCAQPLVVRLFYREDLNGRPLTEVKTHCSQCLFKTHHSFAG